MEFLLEVLPQFLPGLLPEFLPSLLPRIELEFLRHFGPSSSIDFSTNLSRDFTHSSILHFS